MSRKGIKLTPELLKSHIAEVIYEDREIGGHRVMHCHLVMAVGDAKFTVYGKKPSTSLDPDNFNVEKGKEMSYANTFSQLWELEAYRALVESEFMVSAIKSADIDVNQYVVQRSDINQVPCSPYFHHGSEQHVRFQVPGKLNMGGGFVATFVSTDNPAYDAKHNDETKEKVKSFLRTELGVEALEPALVVHIAKICHAANRAYCQSLGDNSQPLWHDAPEWQRQSVVKGVKMHLTGSHQPSASHESWMAEKESEGWVYGPVKDPAKKEHPCMVPFDQLPKEQQAKDYIFKSIVDSFK